MRKGTGTKKKNGDMKKVENEKNRKFRLQIDFDEKAYEKLQSLPHYLNTPSKSEVIRCALGVLRWAVDEIWEGNRILVEKKGGGVKKIVFDFIKTPPS